MKKEEAKMLYKFAIEKGLPQALDAIPFYDFSVFQKKEEDLEKLLTDNLFNILFEEVPLMPIFRERGGQPVADIYALNKKGDLIIFELKLSKAGGNAVEQALRYTQEAGQWTFNELNEKFKLYSKSTGQELQKAHLEAFQLERELLPNEFNQKQHIWIVGSAADEKLIEAIDYWKHQGISMDFIPYRVYSISGQYYFEFFSLPYDKHRNPGDIKGVLFDTNRSYDENAIWNMLENKRVSAYGDARYYVDYLHPKDKVFYSHKWIGIIAAAEVIGQSKNNDANEEKYRDVRFLAPIPSRIEGIKKYLPFSHVSSILGKSFFWDRTIKVPYLSKEESNTLLEELKKVLE
jgi:hypothetical protein